MKMLVVLALFGSLSAMACDSKGKSGFVEENDLWISADQESINGITEKVFNDVIDRAEKIYSPIIKSLGKNLKVNRKWKDGKVNASARQSGKTWHVNMYGGLARHGSITADGFAMVLCHELGHHLAGAPRKTSFFGGLRWASSEGQSDYWGAHKCLKKYFETDDNIKVMEDIKVSKFVKESCEKQFADPEENAICGRTAMAGLSLGNFFKVARKLKDDLKFSTPDQAKVRKNDPDHPEPQCRLDTYFQGGLCELAWDNAVSKTDPEMGFCTRKKGNTLGIRPLCWFKPSVN